MQQPTELERLVSALEGQWLKRTKLEDLPPSSRLRCTCRTCGRSRTESVELMVRGPRLGKVTVGDLETLLTCHSPKCGGALDMALAYERAGLTSLPLNYGRLH